MYFNFASIGKWHKMVAYGATRSGPPVISIPPDMVIPGLGVAPKAVNQPAMNDTK